MGEVECTSLTVMQSADPLFGRDFKQKLDFEIAIRMGDYRRARQIFDTAIYRRLNVPQHVMDIADTNYSTARALSR